MANVTRAAVRRQGGAEAPDRPGSSGGGPASAGGVPGDAWPGWGPLPSVRQERAARSVAIEAARAESRGLAQNLRRRLRGAPSSSLSLSNNCNGADWRGVPRACNWRSIEAANINLRGVVGRFGPRCALLTLTTADGCQPPELVRRWKSFRTGFLPRLGLADWIRIIEPGSVSGRWHLHILAACPVDVHTGFDFVNLRRSYDLRPGTAHHRAATAAYASSACPWLRSAWRMLREDCGGYGFGRHELVPVRDLRPVVMGCYLAKYLTKACALPPGLRRWEGKRGVGRPASCRMGSVRPAASVWRSNWASFAAGAGIEDAATAAAVFGKAWRVWSHTLCGLCIGDPEKLRPLGGLAYVAGTLFADGSGVEEPRLTGARARRHAESCLQTAKVLAGDRVLDGTLQGRIDAADVA